MKKIPFKYKYVWNAQKQKYFQEFTTEEERAKMLTARNLMKQARTLYQECYDYCAANRINLGLYFEENSKKAKEIQMLALAAQELVKGLITYDLRKYMVAGDDVKLNTEE